MCRSPRAAFASPTDLRSVREDGAPIQGLYAAGAVGQGGLLLEGHGHHLAWAFISGRIAGRNAAFDVPRGKPLTDEIGEVAL